jgi:cell volume regulation protein A
MAVVVILSLFQILVTAASFSLVQILQPFFIQISLGALAGWVLGSGLVKLINWLDLEFEGLYPVLTIAFS